MLQWFDSARAPAITGDRIDWVRVLPFLALHLGCLGVLWVGVSGVAVAVAIASYLIRMFAITAFYHRYFSHKAFAAPRWVQFAFALLGAAATQRGPLWWAAHHRDHHRFADTPADPHYARRGWFWSHIGWFLAGSHFRADSSRVADWRRFPELRWLDRFDLVVPVAYAALMYALGAWLERSLPELGTSGAQMLVWGYLVSTVVLTHVTLMVNSLGHRYGRRRFDTKDDSRNSWWLALATLGEGWHNNHHRYAGAARQGFYWWEVDVSYYVLRALAALGWVQDLRPVPARVLEEGRR